MQALSPQQAKDLLGLMTGQGLLQTQATYNTAATAIPAIFGSQVNSEVQVSPQCLLNLRLFCQHWSRSRHSVRDNIEMLVGRNVEVDYAQAPDASFRATQPSEGAVVLLLMPCFVMLLCFETECI